MPSVFLGFFADVVESARSSGFKVGRIMRGNEQQAQSFSMWRSSGENLCCELAWLHHSPMNFQERKTKFKTAAFLRLHNSC